MIKISPFVVQAEGATRLLTSRIDDFELWFRVPADHAISAGGAALASAALLPAMARGEVLVLPPELPLDSVFLENLDQLQEIYLAWQQPLGLNLQRVRIESAVAAPAGPANAGVMSYFSGGVDSTYTAMRQRHRIAKAVLLRGIDMQLANTELWDAASAAAARLAAHFELPLVTVETNIRFLGYHHGLKWALHYQGAGLASIAHLLGFEEALVAASSSLVNLNPYGSHPMTDPLWSSDPEARKALGRIRRASLRKSALRDLDASIGSPLKRLKAAVSRRRSDGG